MLCGNRRCINYETVDSDRSESAVGSFEIWRHPRNDFLSLVLSFDLSLTDKFPLLRMCRQYLLCLSLALATSLNNWFTDTL
jgi:hypothetical protein